MIDRSHDLSVARQAELPDISRGSVYCPPRPAPSADLVLMRRIYELHIDFPLASSRMLQGLLKLEGFEVGRLRARTLKGKWTSKWPIADRNAETGAAAKDPPQSTAQRPGDTA